MPDPITQDFKGVHLATTGTFNASTGKVKFTRQDFDDMAEAAKDLAGKVDFPLKLGHNEGQELLQEDGLPAAGWIENVRREGNDLMADFMRVPEKIADIIKGGGLRKRSIEAMRNVELAGQRFKFVLTGVALLGEELPAVDSLDDIAALYTAAKLDWPDTEDESATALVFITATEHDGGDEVEDMIREVHRITGQGNALARLEGAIAEIKQASKGTKTEIHMGQTLGAGLTTIVGGQVTEQRTRQSIIQRMATASGISPSTVQQIMGGNIECPPLQRLRGLARALSVPLQRLVDMANRDGCDYELSGEKLDMEITKELLAKLGLADDATEDQVTAAISELKDKVDAGAKGGPNDGDDDANKDGDNAAMDELKAEGAKQAARILELENDKASQEATQAADAAIKASKFAPAVRGNLIKMALGDPKGFDDLVAKTPVIAGMTTGVIGSSENPETFDFSPYEPNTDVLKLMAQTGVTREEHILQAIADAEAESGNELVGASVKASLAPKKAD